MKDIYVPIAIRIRLTIQNMNIMKKITTIIALLLVGNTLMAQKYFTKTGHISFFSTTPVENIEAHNYQSTSVIDFSSGEMVFSLLMKGFNFEKALMQEHFNEKYVESDQFPKATFKGNIVNFKDVNLKKDGVYKVKITGEMTIHGVTKTVKADGTLEVKAAKIIGLSTFKLPLKDYNINVPSVVSDKIASEMTIKVQMDYSELKK